MKQIFNIHLFLGLIICLISRSSFGETRVSGEQIGLSNLAIALREYMANESGKVPANLEPLAGYIDLQKILSRQSIGNDFTENYIFFPQKPQADLPGIGKVKIILLKISPKDEDKRMAIWMNSDGSLSAGYLYELTLRSHLNEVDLDSLKPMGGVIPPYTGKEASSTSTMTDYQARVVALAREGKIPLDTPTPATSPLPSSTNSITPTTQPPSTKPLASPNPTATAEAKQSPVSIPIVPLAILAAVIVGVVVFLLKRKSP